MQRVKRSTAVAVLPNPPEGGEPGYFAAPNPQGGIDATVPGYEWFNAVQEEICAVVEAAGIALDEADRTQLVAALIKKGMQGNYFSIATAAGTADAITAVFTPAIAALTHGMTLRVRAAAANATTTPTFTPNSGTIAAKTIVKGNGLALAVGDIVGSGHWIELHYDATLDKWVLLNPATFSQFAALMAPNGYQKLPSGLIIQWGGGMSSGIGTGNLAVTFPIAFPSSCFVCLTQSQAANVTVTNLSLSTTGASFTTYTASSGAIQSAVNVQYVAIGK